jgi:hypothetical protein
MEHNPSTSIQKIISGGQTGADRAALDFAIEQNLPHGGWVPRGRKAEDGILAEKYRLREMPTGHYSKRTEKNILDADGTLILSHGPLTGGSALTRELAKQHMKPWIHIDLKINPCLEAARLIREWVGRHDIKVMNVAGARASKDPMIYQATMDVLDAVFVFDVLRGESK